MTSYNELDLLTFQTHFIPRTFQSLHNLLSSLEETLSSTNRYYDQGQDQPKRVQHRQVMTLNIRHRNERRSDHQNEQTRRPKKCATPTEGSLLNCSPKPLGQ
jgi:hypothetical protein